MKRLMIMMLMAALAMGSDACTSHPVDAGEQGSQEVAAKGDAKVLYFHGRQRCITCRTIENLTREVAKSCFEQEQHSGKLKFEYIDISTPEGEKVADRYEVSWSSLLVVKDGKVVNLTDMAFGNARSNPEEFKKQLAAEIVKMLQ